MPPPEEERPPIPPGYTVLQGGQQQQGGSPRVTSLGRPSAIERGGAPGQFIPRGYQTQPFGGTQPVALGAVHLVNANAVRQPTLAQPTVTLPEPTNGNGAPPVKPPLPEQAVPRAKAWGKLKKQDAAELAEYLAEIEKRMEAANIPVGIVKQIREKLDAFAAGSDPEEAEISLSETEAAALDVAIMNLETFEGSSAPSFATAAAVVAAVGLITVIAVG